MKLFVGKKFKIITKNAILYAEIIDIQNKYAIVLINNKKFKMDKDYIIKMLSEYEQEKTSKTSMKCKNCMEYKNGNCFGKSQICDEFRYAPIISDEEINRWNKKETKTKINRNIIREYDDEYIRFRYY